MLLAGEVLPWLSPLWLVLLKKLQFGIFVFVAVQEKIDEAISKVVNVIEILYFYENFFRFTKKFLPILTL